MPNGFGNGWLESVKRHGPALTAMIVIVWLFIGYINSRDERDAVLHNRTMSVLEENTRMLGRVERLFDQIIRNP